MKTIHSIAQNENIEDSTVLESLSEASSFMNTIPKELQDRQNYLNMNKDYRLEYDQLKDQFASWIKEAKRKLKSAEEDKNDHKNIVSNLENFKVRNINKIFFVRLTIFTMWFFSVILQRSDHSRFGDKENQAVHR